MYIAYKIDNQIITETLSNEIDNKNIENLLERIKDWGGQEIESFESIENLNEFLEKEDFFTKRNFESKKLEEIHKRKKYLLKTDWILIKALDEEKPLDKKIKELRKEAREQINQIEKARNNEEINKIIGEKEWDY